MADFSALKTAIQANIRTNGNEEITGAILQDILLSMVSTMGDGAINALAEALQAEITNRQNVVGGEATARQEADSALSGRINAEVAARGEADTLLQNAINGITTRINEGYVYAGIATPSTNPSTPAGKVFYIALQAGTYTNFSSLAITQGITILKYNGTAWSQEQLVGIDDNPTAGSNNLVKSGGVTKKYSAYSFTDNGFCNELIKEMYLFKSDGTQISNTLYINEIYVDYENEPNVYLTAILINDGNQAVSALTSVVRGEIFDILAFGERNNSKIFGYALLDKSGFGENVHLSNINASINKKSLYLNYSPSIKNYLLNNQVNNINSHLEEIDNEINIGTEYIEAPDIVIKEGYYLYADGVTEYQNAAFDIVTIPLSDYDVSVRVTGTHFANGATIVFKNSNNSVIGRVVKVISTIYNTVEANIPSGAVKAQTTYLRGAATKNEVQTKKSLSETVEKAEVVDYNADYDVTRSIGLTQGSANLSDGSVTQNNAFGKSGKFDMTKYDYIRVYTRVVNTICYVKWFNDGNVEVLPRGNGDSSNTYKWVTYKKPEGATKAEVSVIDWTSDDYVVEVGNYMHTKTSDENGLSQNYILKSLPNVTMIPIFGQSLSIGAASLPVITSQCKYPAAIMFQEGVVAIQKSASFFKEFVPLREKARTSANTGETIASGCAEQLIELLQKEEGLNKYSRFWIDHKILFVSCGDGSKTIADLMNDYYNGLVNAVTGAVNVANGKGWNVKVPAVIYIQGETDQKEEHTDYATYKTAIESFANTFNTDVKNITGQEEDIKVIMYQTCSQNIVSTVTTPTYANTAMDIPTAQMELVRDNTMFGACNPAYILDHSISEPIHLSAVGEKMMGLYVGKSLKNIMLGQNVFRGVTPASYTISGNILTIDFNVPCPPLKFNTSFVREVENMGFAIINSSDNNILSSVSVFDNKVTLTCSDTPLNCKLYYGFNGLSGKDGRLDGSRGNLCDNGGLIYNGRIAEKQYVLNNYCYAFAKLLSSNSGII